MVANGIPLAVTTVCITALMIPLSGAPAAPGVSTTSHPIETGGPGIAMVPSLELSTTD
jgi:hypothetical protein